MDILGELPPEMSREILEYMNCSELIICSQVSSRWKDLVNDNGLWLKLLPDYEFVTDDWANSLVESRNEAYCSVMERYLAEKKLKDNLKRAKSRVLRVNRGVGGVEMSRDGWLDHDGSLYLWNGKKVQVQLPEKCANMKLQTHIFSYNGRHLAITTENYILLYEYEPPNTRVELLRAIAIVRRAPDSPEPPDLEKMTIEAEEDSPRHPHFGRVPTRRKDDSPRHPDWGRLTTRVQKDKKSFEIMECPNLDNSSLADFIDEHASDAVIIPYFFTGVNSGQLRLVVRVQEHSHYVSTNLMLNLENNSVVMEWDGYFTSRLFNVMESWDRNGVCLWMDNQTFTFYDVYGCPTRDIVSDDGEFHDFDILYEYSMAFGIYGGHEDGGVLYVWYIHAEHKKQLSDYDDRVLRVECHGKSVAYFSIDRGVIEIMTAPDWITIAYVPLGQLSTSAIHMVHFSDSSIIVVTSEVETYFVCSAAKPRMSNNFWVRMGRLEKFPLMPGTSIAFVRGHIICFSRGGKYITMDFRHGRSRPKHRRQPRLPRTGIVKY